jgi:hypothetical protein
MWSKSNPLVVFALDLMSAYEGEHMIFGLLGQLASLRMMFSNYFHLPANDNISLFFMAA